MGQKTEVYLSPNFPELSPIEKLLGKRDCFGPILVYKLPCYFSKNHSIVGRKSIFYKCTKLFKNAQMGTVSTVKPIFIQCTTLTNHKKYTLFYIIRAAFFFWFSHCLVFCLEISEITRGFPLEGQGLPLEGSLGNCMIAITYQAHTF